MPGTAQEPEVSGWLSRRAFVGGLAVSAAGLLACSGCGVLPAPPTSERTARLGLISVASSLADVEKEWQGFLQRAAELGWREGQNLKVEPRLSVQRDLLPKFATELVSLPVDIILAGGTAGIQAAQGATSSIPIVMAGLATDPVALGLVESLARPGGNITGMGGSITPVLMTKRLQILAEVVPGLRRVSVLVTPDSPAKAQNLAQVQAAADPLGVEVRVEDVPLSNLSNAFESARLWPAQAILLLGDAVLTTVIPQLVELARGLGVPAMYSDLAPVRVGGLMGYAADPVDIWRRAADYVDKILRGARPADLPVQQYTTFYMAVNRTTLDKLGLTLPPEVAAQVTEWEQ